MLEDSPPLSCDQCRSESIQTEIGEVKPHDPRVVYTWRSCGLMWVSYEPSLLEVLVVALKVPASDADTLSMRTDSETHCHCGAEHGGSDHCPSCEQYETVAVRDCGHTHDPEEDA